MEMIETLEEFIQKFNPIENAMDMRNFTRWNGRDLSNKENLSEHTHLVTACAIELYDVLNSYKIEHLEIDFENLVRYAMLHDSLEVLRGDILSVTKDAIQGLRKQCDEEEAEFLANIIGNDINEMTKNVVRLADLMACYKFVERELKHPSNDFAAQAYLFARKKYREELSKFYDKYHEYFNPEITDVLGIRTDKLSDKQFVSGYFVKGYKDDAGSDIILTEDVTFMPMSSCSFGLNVRVTPECGKMALLCARTSAAAQGLVVAMCPIDPNFNGELTAIVHNVSNTIVEYKAGESFCQVVMLPIEEVPCDIVKKPGLRSSGKLGSTGR